MNHSDLVSVCMQVLLNKYNEFSSNCSSAKAEPPLISLYILVNVNGYNEEELLEVANSISCIIMMDQSIVARHKEIMLRRLNKIMQRKDKLAPEKMELIIEWLMEVFSKRFPAAEAKKIIENLREGKLMTYAIERLMDNEVEKGRQEGRVETAKEMLADDEPMEKIIKYTKLLPDKIEELKKEMKH